MDDIELHIGFETADAPPGTVWHMELPQLELYIDIIKQNMEEVRREWPTTRVFQALVRLSPNGTTIHFYRADDTDVLEPVYPKSPNERPQ